MTLFENRFACINSQNQWDYFSSGKLRNSDRQWRRYLRNSKIPACRWPFHRVKSK